MSDIKISKRLEKVANCVERGNKVADIGCDHAYTSIYMIKNGIASKVIAMDINKGPLQKAENNIREYGCENDISIRLSDGAMKLCKGEVDTILISGMGGRLTNKILDDSIEIVKECSQLVLQPQSEIHLVREYLRRIGFVIRYEDMLIDDGKYYVIINAYKEYDVDKEKRDTCIQEIYDRYGEYLLKNKNEVLYGFLLKEMNKVNDILNSLLLKIYNRCDDNEKKLSRTDNRIKELKNEQILIGEALKYYEL